MKRKITNLVFICLLTIAITFTTNVKAVALTEEEQKNINITTNVSSLFGPDGKVETKYNEEDGVWDVTVTITATSEAINKFLNQVPGVDPYSLLSNAYYELRLNNMPFTKYEKENKFFEVTTTTPIDDLKSQVLTKLGDDDKTTNNPVYPIAAFIQYSTNGGKNWSKSQTKPNGTTSTGQDLLTYFSGKTINDLEYGKDYRIGVYNNLFWLNVWRNQDDADQLVWVRTNYKIAYPVTANLTNKTSIYYPTIEQALKSESKDIIVNKDVTVNSDITIPEGTKLTVKNGVKVTLANDSKITNNGNLVNNGTIEDSNSKKVGIITNDGRVKSNLNIASAGTEVTISDVQPKLGYTPNVYIVTGYTKTLVVDNKFIMPSGNVEVMVEYSATPVKFVLGENATFDNDDLVFKLDGEFTLFDRLYINNIEVDKEYYTIAEGSTIITIKKSYLEKLSAGDYTLTATYTSGVRATTTFTINGIENPNTIDNIAIIVIAGLISLIGIGASVIYIKKLEIK